LLLSGEAVSRNDFTAIDSVYPLFVNRLANAGSFVIAAGNNNVVQAEICGVLGVEVLTAESVKAVKNVAVEKKKKKEKTPEQLAMLEKLKIGKK